MKKIRKTRRYVGGGMTPYLQTDFKEQIPDKLISPPEAIAAAPGNKRPTNSANFFKSKSFSNVIGKIGGLSQAADTAFDLIGNMTGPATASTVAESRMQTAKNTIGGALNGAKAGMAVGGPVGAAVGAGIGLATGIIGKEGSISTSRDVFDESVDIKYGTGIRGGRRNRSKLHDKAEMFKTGARSNIASRAMAAENEYEFLEDYDTDVQTMAQGGITSSLAYVDDGELLNLPQGNILEVPEEGKPTDSNLVDLPEGTRILSDKRKVPGSKETFAQMGKRLMSKKKTSRTDKYAQNAAMLNEMNDWLIYDKLFAIQEGTKKKQGPVDRFQNGGTKRKYRDFGGTTYMLDPSSNTWLSPNAKGYVAPSIASSNLNPNANIDKLTKGYSYSDILPEFRSGNVDFSNTSIKKDVWASTPAIRPKQQSIPSKTTSIQTPVTTTAYSNVSVTPSKRSTSTVNSTATPVAKPAAKKSVTRSIEPVANELDLSNETLARVGDERAPYIATINNSGTTGQSPVTSTTDKIDWLSKADGLLTDIAALSPVISNFFAKPETFTAQYNPYEGQIRNIMAGRKFDISPAKRAIRENRAIGNYNAANYNPNTGANLAFRVQNQIAANKAISDLYSQASNINNQYAGEYANTLNNLGQQDVQAKNLAIDMNAKSRAVARNIQRTALSQLSQYAQNKQLMKNQKSRDMAMLDMYGPFLEAGYNSKDFASFMKKFKKG